MDYKDLDILYFSKKTMQDYMHDALFLGFKQLGCNVVDIPDKATLHGHRIEEQKHCEQLFFNFERSHLRKSNPDLMIIAAQLHPGDHAKHEQWKGFVRSQVKAYGPKQIAFIDGSDESEYSYPDLYGRDVHFFKREISKDHPDFFSPVNFAPIEEPLKFIPFSERIYDVSYIVTLSHPFRVRMRDIVRETANKLGLTVYVYGDQALLPREEYMRVLSQSKCFVSVRGYGKDCYRYWEIPMRGSVLISENLDLDIPNDFGPSQCFKFDTTDLTKAAINFENVMKTVKEMDDSALQEMAIRGMLHVNNYHTPKKRAEQILNKIFGRH